MQLEKNLSQRDVKDVLLKTFFSKRLLFVKK